MHLIEYLRSTNTSQANFGSQAGVTQARVAQWVRGDLVPLDRCPTIDAATSGQVRCEDLRPDVDWTRDAAGIVTGYHVRVAPAKVA